MIDIVNGLTIAMKMVNLSHISTNDVKMSKQLSVILSLIIVLVVLIGYGM
jgi:hypothetical protein